MNSRKLTSSRSALKAQSRSSWAAIDHTQHYYLTMVLYFNPPPPAATVSQTFVGLVRHLVANVKTRNISACITRDPFGTTVRDSRWGSRDLGQIKVDGFDIASSAALDALLNPPDDAREWSAISEIRGAKVPATQIGWTLHYNRGGQSGTFDVPWDDRAVLVINKKLLAPSDWKPDRIRGLIDQFFEAWRVAGRPYSGHVHVDSEDDIKGGWYYLPRSIAEYPEHREFNHRLWWQFTEDRSRRARGVYWGNYWGPALAKVVGRKALEEFLRHECYPGGPRLQSVTADKDGGMFVAVSNTPLDIDPSDQLNGFPISCSFRMAILQRILRRADAVI